MSNRDKLPRSLTEAFGPYTSDDLEPMEDHDQKPDWLFLLLYAVAIVGFIVLVVNGWLPGGGHA